MCQTLDAKNLKAHVIVYFTVTEFGQIPVRHSKGPP